MKDIVSDPLRDPAQIDFRTEKVRDFPEWKKDPKPYVKFPGPGKISSAEAHLIYRMPFALGPGGYADVGVYKGKSSAILAHGLYEAGHQGTLYSVDYFGTETGPKFSDPEAPGRLRTYFADTGLDGKVELRICIGDSADWGWRLNEPLKFAFIDACHFYPEVKNDFDAWSRNIVRGGMIAFHDVDFYGVQRAISEIGSDWRFVRQVFSTKVFVKVR